MRKDQPSPKTKKMLDLLAKYPKLSQTEAYLMTHNTTNRDTARVQASMTLRRPNVQVYKKKYVREAKKTAAAVMFKAREHTDSPAMLRLGLDAANSILDRELGKATTKVETQNTNLNVNVEASKELGDKFAEFLKQTTLAQPAPPIDE